MLCQGQPEQDIPNPFLNCEAIPMRRCRFLKGNGPSAKRRLASWRLRSSEIFDLSGMDDLLRQSYMKQMGWRPSMNRRQSEQIRRSLRRVRNMLLRLREVL